jgi:hypothetical protein
MREAPSLCNWSRLMVGRIALSKKFSAMIKLTEIREITFYRSFGSAKDFFEPETKTSPPSPAGGFLFHDRTQLTHEVEGLAP